MTASTLTELKPSVYDPVETIETPALIVDLDVMERNVREYAEWAREADVRLRSHVKTHKIPDIARLQDRATDGGGIVCQTLSEAEVMAYGGLDDIYISYMVVGDRKLDRLVRLSEKVDHLSTTVDCRGNVDVHQAAAARHGTTLEVVLELDVGYNRTGVALGEPAVELANYIAEQPNLRLGGVLAYEGQIRGAETEAEMDRRCDEVMTETAGTVELIEESGIPVEEVKVGGTATSRYSGKHPVVTEINPGLYPFNDVREMGHRPWALDRTDVAVSVLTTVISSPTSDRRIVDAGNKSIAVETDPSPVPRHRDDIEYYAASEEHGWVDVGDTDDPPGVGDTISFLPPHACTTFNLHDTVVGVRDDRVEDVWEVAARGKVK